MQIGQNGLTGPSKRDNPDKNGGVKETGNLINYEVIFQEDMN